MAYSGKFIPKNRNKYKGNPKKIVYRSLWERSFMKYCDSNPSILEWSSEEIIIPYYYSSILLVINVTFINFEYNW